LTQLFHNVRQSGEPKLLKKINMKFKKLFRKTEEPTRSWEQIKIGELQIKIGGLLRYSNPFAISKPIEPSPGHPSDYIDSSSRVYQRIFDAFKVPLDPKEIRAALMRDSSPIPATTNREGYQGDDHLAYWLSGFAEYKNLISIAGKYGVTGGSYFDFGGSTGRTFRHFYFQSTAWNVWSSDFKMTSVHWNLMNFPSDIMVFQSMYFPFLPIEDNTFDLITALSVFTHIDETETTWLAELRRIMKPGGIALFTIHNEDTWLNMSPKLRDAIEKYSPEFAALPILPPGRFVSTFRTDDPYRCNTFHSNDYIRKQWSRFFDVYDILSLASGAQAIVVLRKPVGKKRANS
jgi:SAM-dependent methyltransferase